MVSNRGTKVDIDPAKIREVITRGVERLYPSSEFLANKLASGKQLSLYLGVDPTGPTLHLGHLIPLLKLRQFQELGHRVVLLIGDFTGMIGDPTDKSATRTPLTKKKVLENAKGYREQASRVLSFSGSNPVELRYNSEWLATLSYEDFHNLASLVTVEQFLKRDMFEARQKAGKPIYLHEFVYPLLQGYDSVALNIDGEVGGNDQTFNMLVGRDLVGAIQKREKFVLALKLLADPSGKKMGKTEGNLVALGDAPSDMFGKIMSWPDSLIISGFELCTTVPMSEIEKCKKDIEQGVNPKEIKLKLAEAIVSLLHDKEEARKAREGFESAFGEGKPTEFVEILLNGSDVAKALLGNNVITSKSELRRLISEGAVTNLDSNKKEGESFLKTAPPGRYRIGKHRFVRIQ